MSQQLKTIIAAVLASAPAVSDAGQEVGDTYVVPHAGYVWLDDDRGADDDVALGVAIGHHVSEWISLELAITQGDFDLPASRELDLRSYSLDALHIFARDAAVSPYVSIGAGMLRTDNAGDIDHPPIAQAGLGLFINIAERADGSLRFALRPEVKARWAFLEDNTPTHDYLDVIGNLGFQFAFGAPRPAPAPAAAPEPPPPAPPPPPPPPPAPKDSDGDGVLDPNDRCPDTPRGVAVDAQGCPRRGSATLQGVTFEFNSATLTAASRPVLDDVAADLKRYPRLKVELQGHTDSVGADAYNLRLSQQRASSVREYLISQGVAETQLTAKGYGETQPVADNSTETGRAHNRRVDMSVVDNPGDVDVQVEPPKP